MNISYTNKRKHKSITVQYGRAYKIMPLLQNTRHMWRRHRATPSNHRTVSTQASQVTIDLSYSPDDQ